MKLAWIAGVSGAWMMSVFAWATDAPVLQPPPDWVKPAALDMQPSKSAKDAPTAALLYDYQIRFLLDSAAFYSEFVVKAQTPQGLPAIGNINLPWDPATQRLLIHKLKVIHKDGSVTDILANGPGFLTLRRETKLEAATLDGTLTATTQIEGLEVGDAVDVSYTVEQADPLLKGRIQQDFLLNMGDVRHFHLRAMWPNSMTVAHQSFDHAPQPVIQTRGDWTEASLSLDDTSNQVLPKNAPPRYLRGPELQFSNFTDWGAVSAQLAGEFEAASVLGAGSPLEAEIHTIAEHTANPVERAAAALTLVQDRIRYVLLALDGGGLKPAAADLTWTRRFADCKGKTVLLLALLHGLGIEAEPALVSTAAGDGLDERLPMLRAFDHVLVRAVIGGRVYWLDGTRTGDRSLDRLRTPPFHWALPVRTSGGKLIALPLQDIEEPAFESSLRMDASTGLTMPAPAQGEMIFRGDSAIALNLQFSKLTPADLDRGLKELWHKRYDFIEISNTAATYDPTLQEERLTMDGSAKIDWSQGGYEVAGAAIAKIDVQREAGPDRDAPYVMFYPHYERHRETIVLPARGSGFTVNGPLFDETRAGLVLHRQASISQGEFNLDMSSHTLGAEFLASEAPALSARMADLSKQALRLVPPRAGVSTAAERSALIATDPVTFEDYMKRANAFLDNGKWDQAVADFDKAVALNPSSSRAVAGRGVAWAFKLDAAHALADANLALSLNPKEYVAYHARGILAEQQHRWKDAIDAYSQALAINEYDQIVLKWRSQLFQWTDNFEGMLRDCEQALKTDPLNPWILECKGNALVELDRTAEAIGVADHMVALGDKDPAMLIRAASLYHRAGRADQALVLADQAVAAKPTVEDLLARSRLRSGSDLVGALSDAMEALKLNGKSYEVLADIADLGLRAGNWARAADWERRAVSAAPRNPRLLAALAGMHHKLGMEADAAAEIVQARHAAQGDSGNLNGVCWNEGIFDYSLTAALADCESALALDPGKSAYLDSRGFVLLKLARNEEAFADYDAALAVRPALASSLFGRSLAERRLGRIEAAERDRQAAIGKDPTIEDTYRIHGLVE